MQELAHGLLKNAKKGDVAACKLLLSYLVGLPAAQSRPDPDPDRLDEHGAEVRRDRIMAQQNGTLLALPDTRWVTNAGGQF